MELRFVSWRRIRDWPVEKIGSTDARPFFHHNTDLSSGGAWFSPTSLDGHAWNGHVKEGGVMVEAGVWMRPSCYLPVGVKITNQQAVQQEADWRVRKNRCMTMARPTRWVKSKSSVKDAGAAVSANVFTRQICQPESRQQPLSAIALDEAGVIVG